MTIEEIKELIEIVDKSNINELKIKNDGFSISLNKGVSAISVPQNSATVQIAPTPAVEVTPPTIENKDSTNQEEGEIITSPMVGTFYHAPSPDSPPFVKVGDTISKGQTLAIIEAMKIMNELEAEFDCKILEVLVKDAQVVEYDTPLFRVKKL